MEKKDEEEKEELEIDTELDTELATLDLNLRRKESRTKDDWERMKSGFKAKIGELQRQLEEKGEGGAEFEELRKERDEYREIARGVSLRNDPEFRRKYDAMKGAIVQQMMVAAGGQRGELEEALKLPVGSQQRNAVLLRVMEGLDEMGKVTFQGA